MAPKVYLRKLFKVGNDWAVRIPKHMVGSAGEFDIVRKEPGLLELRARQERLTVRQLVEKWNTMAPLYDADEDLFERPFQPPRFPELDRD